MPMIYCFTPRFPSFISRHYHDQGNNLGFLGKFVLVLLHLQLLQAVNQDMPGNLEELGRFGLVSMGDMEGLSDGVSKDIIQSDPRLRKMHNP